MTVFAGLEDYANLLPNQGILGTYQSFIPRRMSKSFSCEPFYLLFDQYMSTSRLICITNIHILYIEIMLIFYNICMEFLMYVNKI